MPLRGMKPKLFKVTTLTPRLPNGSWNDDARSQCDVT